MAKKDIQVTSVNKATKLENKLNKQENKASKTRAKLDKVRAEQRSADGSFSNPASS